MNEVVEKTARTLKKENKNGWLMQHVKNMLHMLHTRNEEKRTLTEKD